MTALKTTGRWAGIIAFTTAAGLLVFTLADAWLPAADEYGIGARQNSLDVLSLIGAAAGFWFIWTGRLARLFRKVS